VRLPIPPLSQNVRFYTVSTFCPLNSVDHYENFPVASVLVPKAVRKHVIAIYQFARYADDIADEGDASPTARMAHLHVLSQELNDLFEGKPAHVSAVVGLKETIRKFPFTPEPFQNLLSAFSQDVMTSRYANREVLMDYCRRSANPVGRMVLTLLGIKSPQARAWSDSICTGLQLTNFWQDVGIDAKKGRIYIPQDAIAVHRLSEVEVMSGIQPAQWRHLMYEQVNWAQLQLTAGVPLLKLLPGRMKWEIAFTVAGGLRILDKLRTVHYNMFTQRPTLSWRDAPALTWSAIRLVWRATFHKTL
jgi:squalene synthase HpnC